MIALALLAAAAGLLIGWLARGLSDREETPPAPAANDTPASLPVTEAIADPLLLVEGQRVLHANAAARAVLGGHVEDEDVRLAIRHPAAADLLAGREEGPVLLHDLGGRGRRWELSARDLDPTHRLLQLRDRSDALAAERMRVDFVANASHELRTPLATLIGFIETLAEADAPEDAPTRARFLHIMGGEAKRMQRLIDDLMSLSRIEADRYSVPDREVDLGLLTGLACADIRPSRSDGGRLACETPDDLPRVLGDEGQLSQLLHNVIGNAFKYGRAGTPIRVTLARLGDDLQLKVADEGDGIAPEHLPRLTERFYRVDPGRSRAVGGTGLGLAIVKHIVERHRGRLDIASEVGRGTVVTVTLPAVIKT